MAQFAWQWLLFVSLMTACAENMVDRENPVEASPSDRFSFAQTIRIPYGEDSLQFGDLRIPEGNTGLFPVIMIIHGGCWRSQYTLDLMDSMSIDLTDRGYATWNIEYRRTEDVGGGWPGTFHDVATALAHLQPLAETYPIDPDKILVTGHSAGGHLALWLGAYQQLEANSALRIEESMPTVQGIVSLAGIVDLVSYYSTTGCGSNTVKLIGGLPKELPARYSEGSPITFAPLQTKQILITGEEDNIVPINHVEPYYQRSIERGGSIEHKKVMGADHFAVITPGSIAWDTMLDAYAEAMKD